MQTVKILVLWLIGLAVARMFCKSTTSTETTEKIEKFDWDKALAELEEKKKDPSWPPPIS